MSHPPFLRPPVRPDGCFCNPRQKQIPAVKSGVLEFFQAQQHTENFEREAETWVNLGLHPHTVSCYYVRRLGGIPRIFTEFVEGGSLADWIRSRRLWEGGPDRAMGRIKDEVTEDSPGDFPIRRERRSSAAWINRQHARPDHSSAAAEPPMRKSELLRPTTRLQQT